MTKSDIRYLVADIFRGQLGAITDKAKCSVILRLTPEDNEQAAIILDKICKIPDRLYFQAYGLDDESSQIVFLIGGKAFFAVQVFDRLCGINFDFRNYSSQINL